MEALTEAGIERADVVVCSTDGDNTNIIVAQLAKKRFQVPKVVVRVLDPYRAEWYSQQGLHTVCPTQVAIDMLTEAVIGEGDAVGAEAGLMYIIIAGAGKVGWNLARELIGEGHEVTLIESDRNRYLMVEEELEHSVQHGDASELWVLERAGIVRADMVVAVTGDDEDNMLISQVAKEKYLVEHTIARVNNPRNLEHFELLGVRPVVSATDLILRLIEHEVPAPRPRAPARPAPGAARDHRARGGRGAPAAGKHDRGAGAAGGLPGRVGAAQRDRLRAQGRHR